MPRWDVKVEYQNGQFPGCFADTWHPYAQRDSVRSCVWAAQAVTGWFASPAVPGNHAALAAFQHNGMNLWRCALRRRSQKGAMTWKEVARLADRWLPKPRILHLWPLHRFAVGHPRQEPYAGIRSYGSVLVATGVRRRYREP